jgi:hypothetical protein
MNMEWSENLGAWASIIRDLGDVRHPPLVEADAAHADVLDRLVQSSGQTGRTTAFQAAVIRPE